jgi:hypothetical protein
MGEPALTAEQISSLLGRLREQFGRDEKNDGFELTDTWERPRSGSFFYRVRDNLSTEDLVVKIVPEWPRGTAGAVYQNMVDLDDMIASAVHGIRPLAWADDPPTLVMPYVGGDDVVTILRRHDDVAWTSGHMVDWMEWAGSMLAAYHRQTGPATELERGDARRETHDVAAKLRVKREVLDHLTAGLDWATMAKRRFGDFGPGNLQGTPEGSLYLLDPPEKRNVSLIHRDVANFLFELRRQLAGHGFTRHPAIPGRFDEFRMRFISGYLRGSPGLDLSAGDEALIALFEANRAAGLAMKRFPSRLGDVFWFGRLALRRRGHVTRSRR